MGEISLVGPRPPLPSEIAHYDEYAQRRLTVPQGITCLWQINGRCDVSFDEWMRLDNHYIDTWSPLRDLAILARTIPAVTRSPVTLSLSKGAVFRSLLRLDADARFP